MPEPLTSPPQGGLTCWDCQMTWKIGEETEAFFKHDCVVESYETGA